MELPIQIMIVLFVTVLVASVVIMFSTDMIRDAKNKMKEPWIKERTEDKIIEVETITDKGIEILIEECYEKNKQEALSKTLCFVVHGQTNAVTILTPNAATIVSGVKEDITVQTFDIGGKTLYVYYNPAGNQVEISS